MSIWVLSIFLAAWAGWSLARPHLAGAFEAADTGPTVEVQDLLEQKERSLQVLKDLELDFSMRKIGEEDYQQMKRSLYRELSSILDRIDRA